MMIIVIVSVLWCLLSLPAGVVIGRMFAAGRGWPDEDE